MFLGVFCSSLVLLNASLDVVGSLVISASVIVAQVLKIYINNEKGLGNLNDYQIGIHYQYSLPAPAVTSIMVRIW